MPASRITIVKSDNDWQALYVNDALKLQNHSVDVADALEVAAKILGEFVVTEYYDESDYLEEVDSWYPSSLKELKDYGQHSL